MIPWTLILKAAFIYGFLLAVIAPRPVQAGMAVSGWWEGNLEL